MDSWVKWRRASQVPKPPLNLNWVGGKTFDLSTKPKRRLTSKYLKTSDKMGVIEISLYLEEEEDFGKVVTFAVSQLTEKEPCRIRIRNTTANLGAKISTILIKTKRNKPSKRSVKIFQFWRSKSKIV